MQNKGFVKVIAVLLTLACIFSLSFSLVTRHYESKAADLYGEGTPEYQSFLDSVAGDTVFLGYTLKECREHELGLGLDLKGGMNVVMEVSISDILKTLAGSHSEEESFVKAMKLAKERQLTNQRDFVDLFAESFKEVNPGMNLAAVFSTYELREKVDAGTSDKDVIKVLKEEIEASVNTSFNVLRSRIDHFGVVQPNLQRLDVAGRILIEMPGVKEPERVRKLLQGTANLEFWPTFNFAALYPQFVNLNEVLRNTTAASTVDTVAKTDAAAAVSGLDSLMATTAGADSLSEAAANYAKVNPLHALIQYNIDERSQTIGRGPLVGYVHQRDTAKVAEYLRFGKEKRILPESFMPKWSVKAVDPAGNYFELIAIESKNKNNKAPLTGSVILDANSEFAQHSSSSVVNMEMNQEGAQAWARLTKENINKSIAIVLDDYVYSYPNVKDEITGGRSEISGRFDIQEAKDLANVLKSGKMPAPTYIVQEEVVGPSLGKEAITAGMYSFIVAFCMVLIYMIFYYGLVPGLIADIALVCNVFFIFGVSASFGVVMTLPGIAGIVLTLGMAVDANVLIYERIREELRAGKDVKSALADGYRNAFSAIIDSNITTILIGLILALFGTGPIRGFAMTLIIGVICSFFTAIFISRLIFEYLLNKTNKFNDLKFVTKITEGWFQGVNIDFIGKRKMFYILSSVVLLLGVASLAINGLKKGIDFSGGRNFIVRFEQPVSTVDIADKLKNSFGDNGVSVITIGGDNQVRISTNYKINDEDKNVDSEIEALIYEGVKPLMNNDVTLDMFLSRYTVVDGAPVVASEQGEATFGLQSSQKVGPTMADDIKTSAIWAVIISLFVIALYIFARFRNFAFSIGAVVSLMHDTLFIFGLFSILQNIMPFSMEIDQSFIAAILTVIGYSINDSVVIFDRIRENLGLYPNKDVKSVINTSLNSTLSRTFSTSMSTFLVLLIIFLFGGETIRGFIFAMLIGVAVGTYSSWFMAAPVAYDFFGKNDAEKLAIKKDVPEEKPVEA